MDRLSTHVLDSHRGAPAAGLAVRLEQLTAEGATKLIFQGATGPDGRLLLHDGPAPLPPACYRLVFATGEFFARSGLLCRFPRIIVSFAARAGEQYHLPLYVGPHTFTTYRGS